MGESKVICEFSTMQELAPFTPTSFKGQLYAARLDQDWHGNWVKLSVEITFSVAIAQRGKMKANL